MSKRRPQGTPEEEIEEAARRFIVTPEDIVAANNSGSWRRFVENNLLDSGKKYSPAGFGNILDAMEDARLSIVDFGVDIGIKEVRPFPDRPNIVRYRDTAGDYQKIGTWVSRAQIAGRIMDMKEQLGDRYV